MLPIYGHPILPGLPQQNLNFLKITFVAIGAEQLGIGILAAIARREGHEVNVAFASALFDAEVGWLGKVFNDRSEVMCQIEEQRPDVLAFSVLTMNYQWMLEVARQTKKLFPQVKTVFGGVHISAIPDRAIARPEVDYVVAGEGDAAFPQILRAIEAGGPSGPIVNTRYKDAQGQVVRGIQAGFIQDLDSIPIADKTIWERDIRIGDRYLIMVSRGCPYRCSFCFNNFFAQLPEVKKGKYVRLRSVDHVMEELLLAKRRYKLKYVDFQDDVFTVYKPWLKEFLQRYKHEIGVPFDCLSHPHYMDEEIIMWLKDAGCRWLQMGVQSMDEDFKYQNLLRYEESNRIEEALGFARKHGLKVKVDHMFGLPGEPKSAQEKAFELYSRQSPARIQTFWTCFLPGTEMMKQAVADGTLSAEQAENIEEGVDFFFFNNTDNIKDPELVRYYASYEQLFRMLPLLPDFLRKRLRPAQIRKLPLGLSRPAIIFTDVIYGVLSGYPYFVSLARHYLFHMGRFLLRKTGWKSLMATRPRKTPWIDYHSSHSPSIESEKAWTSRGTGS